MYNLWILAERLVQGSEEARVERVRRDKGHVDRCRRVQPRRAVGEYRKVAAVVRGLVEVGRVEQPIVASGEVLGDGQLCDVEVFKSLPRVALNLPHI